ncbi:GNAT family N-acetyltransferase [Amycolatopsis sp. H20-H5]|uniref:GNAT family N-acetyltransferase n=1 Tax=Amycolatopsis sp. H20-H5 TaxID=3046309 RepID=UPI002DB84A63|nr:GNAT family protein [Amycolatopsis sp. H20-H5]MEC3981560.1 GNAT family protein [Amycolatopsis sp. H20-H5]
MIAIEALIVQPELRGERVLLTQLDGRFADGLWSSLQDPENIRLTGTHQTFTRAQIDDWAATRPGREDRADYALVRISDGAFLGEVVLNDIDEDNDSASFRISLAGAHLFGLGYGTEATRLALDYAFDVLGLHRVGLEVFAHNPRAERVYEKCGFVREGVLRDALRWEREWHDVVRMSVLVGDRR